MPNSFGKHSGLHTAPGDLLDDVLTISSDLKQELLLCVRRVLRESIASSAGGRVLKAASLSRFVQETQTCVRAALAEEMREQNVRLALSRRIPDELWCLVWGFLSFADRTAITRVCQAWRALAVATPSLWSSVSFNSSQHYEECDCPPCALRDEEEGIDITCGRCHQRWTPGNTNFSDVAAALPRSANLALSLEVSILFAPTDVNLIHSFAELIFPHVARLESLVFDSVDEGAVAFFMENFCLLPQLSRFVWRQQGGSDGFLDSTLSFPALQYLELSGPVLDIRKRFGGQRPDITIPSLQTLECEFVHVHQLLNLLQTCPNLSHLGVYMPYGSMGFRRGSPEEFARCRLLAAGITAVHVSGMMASSEETILELFDEAPRRELGLHYSHKTQSITARAFQIFAALRDGVHLSFTIREEPGSLTVAATDALHRSRKILCPTGSAADVWNHLAPTSLLSITVNIELFPIFSTIFSHAPDVQQIEVLLPQFFDVDTVIATRDPPGAFPAFQTLRFTGLPGSHTTVPASLIAAFVRQLSCDLPVHQVVLDEGVILEGDPDCLATIVDELFT